MGRLELPGFAFVWGAPAESAPSPVFEDDPASGVVASRSSQKTRSSTPPIDYDPEGYEPWTEYRIVEAREASHGLNYGRQFMRLMRQNVLGTNRTRIRVDHEYTQAEWDKFWMMPCLRGWDGEELLHVGLNTMLTDGDIFDEWGETAEGQIGVFPRNSLLINDRYGRGMESLGLYGPGEGPLTGEPLDPVEKIIEGVELHRLTYRPIAYHIEVRSGDRRVPASDMIHVFDRKWVDQVRGRPAIWQGIKALQDVDNLRGYVADDSKKRSRLGWIFKVKRTLQNYLERIWRRKNPESEADLQKLVDDYMDQAINLDPGANLVLDEEVEVVTDQAMGGITGRDYLVSRKNFIGDAGAALGLQYATMAGDNSDGNFGSQRLGRLQDIGFFETYQGLIKKFMEALFVGWIVRASVKDSKLSMDAAFRVMQPGFEAIDPTKTGVANKMNLENALTTRTILAASEHGLDWNTEIFPQWKREQELIREMMQAEAAGGNDAEPKV